MNKVDIDDEETCGDCEYNWCGEECELHGIEIFDDSTACSAWHPKDMR